MNVNRRQFAQKCVARETLTVLKKNVSPADFRKLAWDNAHRIYGAHRPSLRSAAALRPNCARPTCP